MSGLWRYDPDSDDFVPGPLNPFRTKAAYDEHMAANEEWLAERAEERRILFGDPDSKAPGLRGVIDD